jgi:peptidyl-prolyl cis-trans isomerase C
LKWRISFRMNKFVYFFSILLVLPAALSAQEASPAPAPSTPAVLAEMNGYKLTDHDFEVLLQMLPNVNKQTMTPEQRQQMIKNWMQVVAFSKEAEAKGMDQDPVVAEQIQMFKKRLLFERYQKELLSQVKVSEEETRKYFEEKKDQFQTPDQVRVSRIVVATREKADEVRQAAARGVPFEQLAGELSSDAASRQQGGDIGWVNPGSREPELLHVIQTLEPNQISEPFSTAKGWQIVKVTEKRPAVQKQYAEVRKMIAQQLLMKKQRELLETTAKELYAKYEVKIHEAAE